MKKTILVLACIFGLVLFVQQISAQEVEQDTTQTEVPTFKELSAKAADKFKKKFSKRRFIKQIEEQREELQGRVSQLKRYENDKEETPYTNDEELMKSYASAQTAYNDVLDLMIEDIKETKNVFQFHLFDVNTRYKHQLAEANKLGNEFLKSADVKLKGETKFIPQLISWIIKIWPIVKKVKKIYLDHVQNIMSEKLEATKFQSWSEIE